MPQFWLAPSLATAFASTEISGVLDLSGLEWPFETFLLHIPQAVGQMVGAPAGALESVLIGRVPAGKHVLGGVALNFKESVLAFVSIHATPPFTAFHGVFPLGAVDMQEQELVSSFGLDWDSWSAPQAIGTKPIPVESADWEKRMLVVMRRLVAMTLYWLNGREPLDVRAAPVQERAQSVRNGKVLKEALWKPIILGAGYTPPDSAPKGGSHTSPRVHFRRGHLRNQAHGEGRALRRLMWIEPMLVGAGAPAA